MTTGFLRAPADKQRHELIPGQPMLVGATGADTHDSFGVVEEDVAPGDGPPLHVHEAMDELAYILTGEFTWKIGDRQEKGGAGAIAFIPRGTIHTWRNSGSVPGKMLFVFSPAGFEKFLVQLSSVPMDARAQNTVNEMSAPYQTTFVGPPLGSSQ